MGRQRYKSRHIKGQSLEEIVLDANILIEILKNNKKTVDIVSNLEQSLSISSITVMELYYGARDKNELKKIKKFIEIFNIVELDIKISKISTYLIETYAKSHNLTIPDSLIASTCKAFDLTLFTYNKKDFKYIEGLKLYNE